MKKTVFSLVGMVAFMAATAQFSVGVNGNYTMYKGDFQKSTPGVQVRAGYMFENLSAVVVSFNYGMPIKYPSTVTMYDNMGNPSSANTEILYKFRTVNIVGQYNFIGDEETTGRFYGIAGGGYVMVNYKEKIKDNYNSSQFTPESLFEG